jgi:dihydrofolate reductase
MFSIVAAIDKNNGIGLNNSIPWKLKADLEHFRQLTTTAADNKINAVIMGANTWQSLPKKFKPLPKRLNIVLSPKKIKLPAGVLYFNSLENALANLDRQNKVDKIFVIGGAYLYTQAINSPACAYLELTEIEQNFACDKFFPTIPPWYKKIFASEKKTENGLDFRFCCYQAFAELRRS